MARVGGPGGALPPRREAVDGQAAGDCQGGEPVEDGGGGAGQGVKEGEKVGGITFLERDGTSEV